MTEPVELLVVPRGIEHLPRAAGGRADGGDRGRPVVPETAQEVDRRRAHLRDDRAHRHVRGVLERARRDPGRPEDLLPGRRGGLASGHVDPEAPDALGEVLYDAAVALPLAQAVEAASKTAFYVGGGLLAVWAVVLSALGLSRPDFPRGQGAGRLVLLISA